MSDYNVWADDIKEGKLAEISDDDIVMMSKDYFNKMYVEPIIKELEEK